MKNETRLRIEKFARICARQISVDILDKRGSSDVSELTNEVEKTLSSFSRENISRACGMVEDEFEWADAIVKYDAGNVNQIENGIGAEIQRHYVVHGKYPKIYWLGFYPFAVGLSDNYSMEISWIEPKNTELLTTNVEKSLCKIIKSLTALKMELVLEK